MKLLIIFSLMFLLIGTITFYEYYAIPQIVPDDYDCEAREGIISNTGRPFFETGQHYINRFGDAVKKQLIKRCD